MEEEDQIDRTSTINPTMQAEQNNYNYTYHRGPLFSVSPVESRAEQSKTGSEESSSSQF
jgi:hypothetical protein